MRRSEDALIRLLRSHLLPRGEKDRACLMKGTALHRRNSSRTRDLARDQRGEPTRAEALFWQAVRNRRFAGLKFKRQMAIGPYVADFCCFEQKLIVELDGEPPKPSKRVPGMRSARPS